MSKSIEYIVKITSKIDASLKKTDKIIEDIEKNVSDLNKQKIDIKVSSNTTSGLKGLTKSLLAVEAIMAGLDFVKDLALGFHEMAGGIKETQVAARSLGATAEEAEKASVALLALQNQFGDEIDEKEFLKAAKAIQTNYGGSFSDAAERVRQLTVATNGALDLDNITEYANQVDNLGDLSAVIITQTREGLYQDKALDTLKEAKLRMSDLGKAQIDALKGTGLSQKKIEDALNAGGSVSDLIENLFKDQNLSTTEIQKLTTNLLGAAGEDLGNAGRDKLLEGLGKGFDELFNETDEEILKRADRARTLAVEQEASTRSYNKLVETLGELWDGVQTKIFRVLTTLTPIIEKVNEFIKGGFKGNEIFTKMVERFEKIWTVLKNIGGKVFPVILEYMTDMWDIISGITDAFEELWEDVFGEDVFKSIERLADVFIGTFKLIWSVIKPILGVIAETLAFIFQNDALDKLGDKLRGVSDTLKETGNISVVQETLERNESIEKAVGGSNASLNAGVNNAASKTIDNTVKSQASGEVKAITINIDAIQSVENQYLDGQDLEEFKFKINQAVNSILADVQVV